MANTSTSSPGQRALSYHLLEVSGVRRLSPNITRITFTGHDLERYPASAPDQYVKLFFPLAHQDVPEVPELAGDDTMSWYRTYLAMPDRSRPPMRTYTVRRYRRERGEIDVDFVLHGDHGPASRFAGHATPGQRVGMLGPGAIYQPPPGCDWQLLLGDETALPAIGAIVESLPPGSPARAYIEIADDRDRQEFETTADIEINWVPRGEHRFPEATGLLGAVRSARLPAGAPYVWISGESGMVKELRRHMVRERAVPKEAISFTGYWRRGHTEDQRAAETAEE